MSLCTPRASGQLYSVRFEADGDPLGLISNETGRSSITFVYPWQPGPGTQDCDDRAPVQVRRLAPGLSLLNLAGRTSFTTPLPASRLSVLGFTGPLGDQAAASICPLDSFGSSICHDHGNDGITSDHSLVSRAIADPLAINSLMFKGTYVCGGYVASGASAVWHSFFLLGTLHLIPEDPNFVGSSPSRLSFYTTIHFG